MSNAIKLSLASGLAESVDQAISCSKDIKSIKEEEGEIYILYSFDLVNSTKYKVTSSKWPYVFQEFYREVGVQMMKIIGDTVPWKHIGDEILFAKKIMSKKDVLHGCKNVALVREKVLEKLYQSYPCSKNFLDIKSVIWLTRAIEIRVENSDLSEGMNLRERSIMLKKSEDSFDFLGKDIDSGFRLGKFVEHGKIVLGVKYCHCLYKMYKKEKSKQEMVAKDLNKVENIIESLTIISYKKLKGIWNDNPYPIIWYHQDLKNPLKMFKYSDHLESELVQEYIKNKTHDLIKDFYEVKYIEKLIEEQVLEKELELIQTLIEKQIEGNKITKNQKSFKEEIKPKFEVHNSVVFVTKDMKVLVFKRDKTKKIEPNKWEFGSVYLQEKKEMIESLKEQYFKKYSISKDILSALTLFHSFIVEKENIVGLMYLCNVNQKKITEVLRDKTKDYSEYKFIDIIETLKPENIKNIKSDYVKNFESELRKIQRKLGKEKNV